MSIYRARLRNTSNALTLRMSGEQTRLQVPHKLFGVSSWIAHMHRFQRYYGELVELTVDHFWQIADAGDRELRTGTQ